MKKLFYFICLVHAFSPAVALTDLTNKKIKVPVINASGKLIEYAEGLCVITMDSDHDTLKLMIRFLPETNDDRGITAPYQFNKKKDETGDRLYDGRFEIESDPNGLYELSFKWSAEVPEKIILQDLKSDTIIECGLAEFFGV